MERKCPNCNTWHVDVDFCPNCHEPISAKAVLAAEEKNRIQKIANRAPTKLDMWVENWKASKYLLVRGLYYLIFSIWSMFMLILSFFMWLIALTPG